MDKDEIIASASAAIFGKPLVTNVYRSVIVEAMVAAGIPDWRWCSADYAEHDFIHSDGARLEVKQSAAKQTWVTEGEPKPSWDIAARKQVWRDGKWVAAPGRNADIYVLALHDVVDDLADHRDPAQWRFFVIPSHKLPSTKRIGLAGARRLADAVILPELSLAVAKAAMEWSDADRLNWKPGDLTRP